MSKIWLFVVIYSLGIGASGTLLPIVTWGIFGTNNFSPLMGFAVVLLTAGGAIDAIGVPLAGFMFDAMGSYHSLFVITTLATIGHRENVFVLGNEYEQIQDLLSDFRGSA